MSDVNEFFLIASWRNVCLEKSLQSGGLFKKLLARVKVAEIAPLLSFRIDDAIFHLTKMGKNGNFLVCFSNYEYELDSQSKKAINKVTTHLEYSAVKFYKQYKVVLARKCPLILLKDSNKVWTLDLEIQSRSGPHEKTQVNNVEFIRGQLYYIASEDRLVHVNIAKLVQDLESKSVKDNYHREIAQNVADLCSDGNPSRVFYATNNGDIGVDGKIIGTSKLSAKDSREYYCMAKHRGFVCLASTTGNSTKDNLVELFSSRGTHLDSMLFNKVKDSSYKHPKHMSMFSFRRTVFGIVSRMTDELYVFAVAKSKLVCVVPSINSHADAGSKSIYGFIVDKMRSTGFDIIVYGYDTLAVSRLSF